MNNKKMETPLFWSSMASSTCDCEPQWDYDVFLSFRGADTRYSFTSHLYQELQRKEIRAFIDDKGLAKGREITPQLLTAIRSSRSSIVILSTQYASSNSCLDELAEIRRRHVAGHHRVYPVFFHVDPSAVRHQTGTFRDAFDHHEEKYDSERVQNWRTALTYVSRLNGWHIEANRYETEVIAEIVNIIDKDFVLTGKLKRKLGELDNIMKGLESRKKQQQGPGKKVKKQVENWFHDVQAVQNDISGMESGSSSEMVSGMKEPVENLVETANIFSGGLVVDDPSWTVSPFDTSAFIDDCMEETLNVLKKLSMDDHLGTIGVHGMGGVGKTTIVMKLYNWLQQDAKKHVVWVTVSKDRFDIIRLQTKIAEKFGVRFSKVDDELERATKLFNVLSRKEEYVLILDDLWGKLSLPDVGIPPPSSNKSKVIITSRSLDVLKFMDCKVVPVNPLGEQMALKLFQEKVGKDLLNQRDLVPVVQSIAKECSGLPLAIVIVASSMKGVYELGEWRNALNELRDPHLSSIKGIDHDAIFRILRFSYDRLKDTELQQCFLSLAFYPEDTDVREVDLIFYWIGDGLVREQKRRRDEIDRCKSIMNRLVSDCLLLCDTSFHVKMHDLVRDMALHIMSEQRFLVQAGIERDKMLGKEELGESVVKVSLIRAGMKFGDFWEPPSAGYPFLTTLLLSRNFIDEIPECFFKAMPNLMFLDLSKNPFEFLPNSLSDLEKLTSLNLQHCYRLKKLPCLSKLQGLKQLDLDDTDLTEFPMGMGELVNLKYLVVTGGRRCCIPGSILGKLVSLQGVRVSLDDVSDLKDIVESLCAFRQLYFYDFRVGDHSYMGEEDIFEGKLISLRGIIASGGIQLPLDVLYLTIINSCSQIIGDGIITSLMNAINLEHLQMLKEIHIQECHNVKKLFLFECMPPNLEVISVSHCKQIEVIFSSTDWSLSSSDATQTQQQLCLPKIRKLSLKSLPQLRSICTESTRFAIDCNAIVEIKVRNCLLLRRMPLHLPLLPDGRLSAPPCLQRIGIHPFELWHSLQWGDHPDAKAVLRPFLRKYFWPNHSWQPVGQVDLDAS